MNITRVLERVFQRATKENVIEMIIQKQSQWSPEKKNPKKSELKDTFLSLAQFINEDEVEDFVEMAVMSKTVGLPAYTYSVRNLEFLDPETNGTEVINLEQIENHTFQEKYTISIESVEDSTSELKISFRLKEYAEVWKTGVRNIDSLSAVYKINVTLDKRRMVVTIFTGNHYVQEVISNFMASVLKWPLQNYRIREITNQVYEIGNASFKTALLLDLVSNRLQNKGIFSKFSEIKFNTKNKKHTNQGIRNITINGKNLLSSQLACEYITLGSDIISFKINMTYADIDFSTLFFLKGNKLDILKIVVAGQEDTAFKKQVIDIIQEEYIDMCNNGILNLVETRRLLDQIYRKFIDGDKISNEVIQNSTLKLIEAFSSNISKFDLQDENIVELVEIFYSEYKAILDTVGYDESNSNLSFLKEVIGIDEDEEFDIDDQIIDEELIEFKNPNEE